MGFGRPRVLAEIVFPLSMPTNDEQPHGPRTNARPLPGSWTELQQREGGDFLHWLGLESRLLKGFEALATALRETLSEYVSTASAAREVWHAAPAVLKNCNDPATYNMTQAEVAYAWLHLLDRYVRTWLSLEHLVSSRLLPMGKRGVRVLDVGTGPGPSAFATHDFYAAMVDFARGKDAASWHQPTELTCVEPASGMNHIRHVLAEHLVRNGAARSVFCMARGLHDFRTISPAQERRQLEKSLRQETERYYDDQRGEWHDDLIHTPEEANLKANAHRRYRLFTFSNFLTTLDTVRRFEANFQDILADANAGSVLLMIGGKGGLYPDIQQRMGRLAKAGGFRRHNRSVAVTSANARLDGRLDIEVRWFYRQLQNLAGDLSDSGPHSAQLRAELDGDQPVTFGSSAVHAFRK